MRSLADRVILATGWTRRLLALLCGAMGALAMAPIDFFPALIVPMTAAIWLLDGSAAARERFSPASVWSAASIGWWWGLGYFVAGMWWLGSAFLLEPEKWAWALPFGVIGFPAALALFPAAGFALARMLWSSGQGRVFALAAGLGLTEWLRGFVFTGFPWNEYGMALGDNLVLGQMASLVGVHGLTLLAVAAAALPATMAADGDRRRLFLPLGSAGGLIAALALYGGLRLQAGRPGMVAGVHLRIMQPNLVQDAEFRQDNKDAILTKYLALSDRATSPTNTGLANVTHLIWPETALPTILVEDQGVLARLRAALPPNVTLIAGGFRRGTTRGQDGRPRIANSLQVVGSGGLILDNYDKVHLVPFGEYMPAFLTWFGVAKFVEVPGDFEAGRVRKALEVPGLPPVAPLICYEAIFSGEVVPKMRAGGARPGLLLNVSNDSWFGTTFGPYQHLAHARLRAVEEGLPLVRAATSGVSAVVDPYGRIVARLPVGVADVLDAPLPKAIPETVFARYGNMPAAILWGLYLVGALVWRRP